MPTTRIGDNERSTIEMSFRHVARKAVNSKPFPISKEDFKEFGVSLLPDDLRDRWLYLHEEQPKLVRWGGGWSANLTLQDDKYCYYIEVDGEKIPYDNIPVPYWHELYDDVRTWAEWYYGVYENLRSSLSWLEYCLEHCHSVGQIKRIFPDEIMRFAPDHYLSSLGHAERQSRVPRDFEADDERMETLANILALGTLSPDEQEGLDAECKRRDDICIEQ